MLIIINDNFEYIPNLISNFTFCFSSIDTKESKLDLVLNNELSITNFENSNIHEVKKRSVVSSKDNQNSITEDNHQKVELMIDGFRIEHAEKEPQLVNGVPEVRAGTKVLLRIFGRGFTKTTYITFSAEKSKYGDFCSLTIPTKFKASRLL